MKNWAALGMAVAFATAILATNIECKKSEKLPEEVSNVLPGHQQEAPKPNDKVHKASRLAIKRATDEAAAKIPSIPKKTTIEAMLKLPRPDGLAPDDSTPSFQEKRAGPFETTLWQVDATITEIVLRPDGDYYMTIVSPSGAKSVVEVPDPKLCEGSKKLAEITATRKALEDKFHPTAEPKKINQKAKITGPGFFGFARARDGRPATNGARIMPGLKIDWL